MLAVDQGTTGTTVFLFDKQGGVVQRAYQEFTQYYPQAGWVEHDAEEIYRVTLELVESVLASCAAGQVAAIGVTNQRETTLLWDRDTGKPVSRAIVWQCRRTAGLCDALRKAGHTEMIREKTGLVVDPYFSATKIQWMLDSDETIAEKAEAGQLAFGTIDSWLVWNLTKGLVHVTDYTNAARTMLFNIHTLEWDQELLSLFQIPAAILPAVRPSSEVYGYTKDCGQVPDGIPIAGIAGDQQAALFGQRCNQPGMVKATYGTGCFILMNTGSQAVSSEHGLLTTIAWGIKGKVQYALEGSIFVAGAAVQWLRDELKLVESAEETERLSLAVPDSQGVYVVPAFVGLGAPHWDAYARGTIVGLTRGANRNHLVRAVLESIAYQTKDVVDVMAADSSLAVDSVKVDGGAAANNFLLQFQADILQTSVRRPQVIETTALGAAYLAGLAVGFWDDEADLTDQVQDEEQFDPQIPAEAMDALHQGWRRAVERSKRWELE